MGEINWLSQSLAAISALVVGGIWYGPLFGKAWLKNSGLTEEKIKTGYHPAVLYSIALVLAFVTTIGLKFYIIDVHTWFLEEGQVISEWPFFHGANHAFMIALTFGLIPAIVTSAMFNQRNWKFILISVGYWLLTVSLMGGIIGAFG